MSKNHYISNSANHLNIFLKKNYEGYRDFVKNLTKTVPMVNSAVSSLFAFYDKAWGLSVSHANFEQESSPSCAAVETDWHTSGTQQDAKENKPATSAANVTADENTNSIEKHSASKKQLKAKTKK